MKNNYRSGGGAALSHLAAAILFISAAAFVCLLAAGVLTVRFVWGGTGGSEVTKTPGELEYEKYLASLTTAPADETSAPPSVSDEASATDETQSDPPSPSVIVYPTVVELAANGYKISYDEYNSEMKLAAIELDGIASTSKLYTDSEKTVTTLVPYTLETGGQLYPSYEEHTEARKKIELYMGYIIVDNEDTTLSVYLSDGSFFGTYPADDLTPAYSRDNSDRALFIKNGKYYYLDTSTKLLTESSFDPQLDGRGMFFDYTPSYGKSSSSSLQVVHRVEPVTLSYKLDRSSYYTRFAVDPRIARALYELDPDFAEKVAIRQSSGHYYNYPFKLALDKAKEEIARERAEAATAVTTEVATEPVTEPVTEPMTEPVTEPEGSSSLPETIGAEESPTSPESFESTETTSEMTAETAETAETEIIETTAPETTEEPYDPYIEVSATFEWQRYYYGTSADDIRLGVGYARAYAFSEGYACIIDDYGVLKVINTSGRITANLRYEYRTDAAHGYTYMVRTYYQPFYTDIYHLGYYYFDHGLMRVRILEHEYNEGNVVNYITGDEDILIDPYGAEYSIPSGYKLTSYSDGILLLEREGRYGYYHRDGYWIAQPIYTYALPFTEGIGVIGYIDGLRGAVDTSGNIVIPFEYDDITAVSTGVIACYSSTNGWQLLAKMSK